MNELQLSNDLPQIEFEITMYQKQAGESIFEIGRRLKHVKENELAHGKFREWHESIGIDKDFASKSMKIVDELPNVETLRHLGATALHLIAKLPESERNVHHETSKGDFKKPDDMTVKELKELNKKIELKEKENQQLQSELEQAKKSERIAISRLENLEEREPEVIEKEVVKEVVKEVIPEELQKQLEHYKNKFNQESKSANELRNELAKFKESFSDPEQASDEREIKRLERDSSINAYKISISIQNFIKENAVETYRLDSIIKANPESKIRLQENVELLEEFTTNLKAMLNGRIIIK